MARDLRLLKGGHRPRHARCARCRIGRQRGVRREKDVPLRTHDGHRIDSGRCDLLSGDRGGEDGKKRERDHGGSAARWTLHACIRDAAERAGATRRVMEERTGGVPHCDEVVRFHRRWTCGSAAETQPFRRCVRHVVRKRGPPQTSSPPTGRWIRIGPGRPREDRVTLRAVVEGQSQRAIGLLLCPCDRDGCSLSSGRLKTDRQDRQGRQVEMEC